jgi:hypothetical protein
MRYRVYGIVLIIFFLGLSSCDLFLGLPKGRENPNDEMAQLTYPRVAAISVDSARFSVTWKDAMSWMDSDKEISEALVVWSTRGFLLSPTDPARLLPSYEEERMTSSGTLSKTVSGLSDGDTLYVSFFGKMERGGWLQPLMRKASISGSVVEIPATVTFVTAHLLDKIIPDVSQDVTGTNNISSTDVLVIEVQSDIPEEAVIVSADIDLGADFDGLTVRAAPLTRYWDGGDYYHLMENNLIGLSSASVETGGTADPIISADRAFQAAHSCRSNMIAFDMPLGETTGINLGAVSFTVSYVVP